MCHNCSDVLLVHKKGFIPYKWLRVYLIICSQFYSIINFIIFENIASSFPKTAIKIKSICKIHLPFINCTTFKNNFK